MASLNRKHPMPTWSSSEQPIILIESSQESLVQEDYPSPELTVPAHQSSEELLKPVTSQAGSSSEKHVVQSGSSEDTVTLVDSSAEKATRPVRYSSEETMIVGSSQESSKAIPIANNLLSIIQTLHKPLLLMKSGSERAATKPSNINTQSAGASSGNLQVVLKRKRSNFKKKKRRMQGVNYETASFRPPGNLMAKVERDEVEEDENDEEEREKKMSHPNSNLPTTATKTVNVAMPTAAPVVNNTQAANIQSNCTVRPTDKKLVTTEKMILGRPDEHPVAVPCGPGPSPTRPNERANSPLTIRDLMNLHLNFDSPNAPPRPNFIQQVLRNRIAAPSCFKMTKDTLKVAIMLDGYPDLSIDENQYQLILIKVTEALDRGLRQGKVLRFKENRLYKGTIMMTCADSDSKKWLKEVVPTMTLFNGLRLAIVDQPNLFKMAVWVPETAGDHEHVVRRLSMQNPGLCTEQWRICDWTYDFQNGVELILEIDEASYKTLETMRFRPFLSFQQVFFRRLDAGANNDNLNENP